jgi:hypothetical protein
MKGRPPTQTLQPKISGPIDLLRQTLAAYAGASLDAVVSKSWRARLK